MFVLYRWRAVRLKVTLLLNKIKNDDDENNNKNKPERNLPFLLFTTLTTPVHTHTVKTVLRCAAAVAVCILDVTNNKSFPIIPNISTLNKTN